MEVKHFIDSLFMPYMVQKETFDSPMIVAYNLEGIMNSSTWIEDESGICYIPNLIKIELTFDGNINSDDFDDSKAEIFSIVSTTPAFALEDSYSAIDEHHNTNILKNIFNCFSGEMIALPKELTIYNDLFELPWSYRFSHDHRIYPCVVDSNLVFECI